MRTWRQVPGYIYLCTYSRSRPSPAGKNAASWAGCGSPTETWREWICGGLSAVGNAHVDTMTDRPTGCLWQTNCTCCRDPDCRGAWDSWASRGRQDTGIHTIGIATLYNRGNIALEAERKPNLHGADAWPKLCFDWRIHTGGRWAMADEHEKEGRKAKEGSGDRESPIRFHDIKISL